jgi:hypothetical protein
VQNASDDLVLLNEDLETKYTNLTVRKHLQHTNDQHFFQQQKRYSTWINLPKLNQNVVIK